MKPNRAGLGLLHMLAFASLAWPQFGVVKKRVYLQVRHPADVYVPGRRVGVDARSGIPAGQTPASQLRAFLEQVFSQGGFEVSNAQPETMVRVAVTQFDPRVQQQVSQESRYIHSGYRTEYDKNGKSRQVEDCRYADVSVTHHLARGTLAFYLTVEDVTTQVHVLDETVPVEVNSDVAVSGPQLCSGASYERIGRDFTDAVSLGNYLVHEAQNRLQRKFFGWTTPVEALLATPDELKPGNALALDNQWGQALESWRSASIRKSGTEAYRQYNLGVAYEALAYSTTDYAVAVENLTNAEAAYRKAMELHGEEKYFRPSFARVNSGRLALQKSHEQSMQRAAEAETRRAALKEKTKDEIPNAAPPQDSAEAKRFREYMNLRISRLNRKLEPAEREAFVQDGMRFGLGRAEAMHIVDSENERTAQVRVMLDRYREFYRECWQDRVITPEERKQLNAFREAVNLPEELTAQAEREVQAEKPANPKPTSPAAKAPAPAKQGGKP